MHEKESNTDQTADALFAQIPKEILYFFRNYFTGDNTDPEVMLRAELLAKTLIRVMLQLYTVGIDDEFQPVFVAINYVKPHTGDVTEHKRTYEMIGGEPADTFKLGLMFDEYEKAYKAWVKGTFGVELSDEAADFLQQWGGVGKV